VYKKHKNKIEKKKREWIIHFFLFLFEIAGKKTQNDEKKQEREMKRKRKRYPCLLIPLRLSDGNTLTCKIPEKNQ